LKKQKKIIEKSPLGIKNPKRAFVFGLSRRSFDRRLF